MYGLNIALEYKSTIIDFYLHDVMLCRLKYGHSMEKPLMIVNYFIVPGVIRNILQRFYLQV